MPVCYLGEIRLFAFQIIPEDWAPCDGRSLSVKQNQALFTLIGSRFGGDARTSFSLPDLRGRVVRGSKPPKGPDIRIVPGGSETISLTPAQLPVHEHGFGVTTKTGTINNVVNAIYGAVAEPPKTPAVPASATSNLYASGGPGQAVTIDESSLAVAGESMPHNNMQPFGVLQYCICIRGDYPSMGEE